MTMVKSNPTLTARLENLTSLSNVNKVILNPIFVGLFIWGGVSFLFALHLSYLLYPFTGSAEKLIFEILLPIFLAAFFYQLLKKPGSARYRFRYDLAKLREAHYRLAIVFIAFEIFQIFYGRGFPFYWKLVGVDKTYFDFGLHGLNGFLYSLQLVLSMSAFYLFLSLNRYKFLFYVLCYIVWAMLMLTRFLVIVTILQLLAIYLCERNIRLKTIIGVLFLALSLIYAFGILGDFRTGENAFYALALPTRNWPSFLPTGFLWTYIYVTTPFNNLLNTVLYSHEPLSLGLDTFGSLIPSIFRSGLGYTFSGDLVSQAFNVSSAFIGPLLDFGEFGILVYSFVFFLVSYFYYRRVLVYGRSIFEYAIFFQSLILTIFFNQILDLPILFQFVIIFAMVRFFGIEVRSEI